MANIKPSAESTTAPLLKDHINSTSIASLGQLIKQYQPVFPISEFIEQSVYQLEHMALKDRVNHLSTVLSGVLVEDYAYNAKWLKKLAENWPDREINNGWHSFMAWPLIDYAGKQGLQQPEIALDLLKHLTPLFTAEFAIRPYIETHFELTYGYMLKWCDDADEHVRRLASEGIRPRLPWGGHLKALQQNPQPIFELLNLLKDDNSRYVQKSVANNLNDISKDHPQQVIEICRSWQKNATPQRNWIIRHGLRSLIKWCEPAVFPLLGYSQNPTVSVDFTLLQQQVKLGGLVHLQAKIHSLSRHPQRLVVDYRVWHIKANGRSTAKVYKWRNVQLSAGQSIDFNKSHGFVKLTTRQYYSGNHLIELLINGVVYGKASVDLVLD
jgi:3-methyladenine DNA glycosylase AlkC